MKQLICILCAFIGVLGQTAHAQWTPIYGKQRYMQGLALPFTDTASLKNVSDTGCIVMSRGDSSIYYRFKSDWHKLATGAGTTPSLQQVTDVGYTTTNQVRSSNGTASAYIGPTGTAYVSDGVTRALTAYPTKLQFRYSPSFVSYSTLHALVNAGDHNYYLYNGTTTGTTNDTVATLANIRAGAIDTTSLSARIDSRVKYTDTAAMLTNYAKNSSVALKLSISDTAAMLTPYLRKIDTASLSTRIDARVPYTGATSDVDLGNFQLNAKAVKINGTAGNGHIDLKHQSADAPATGSSTALFADVNGDLKWKNDGAYYTTLKTSGNTADRAYTYPNATTTLIGASDTAAMLTNYAKNSSVALKLNISDTAAMLTNYAKNSSVALKLNISDTAAMLTNYAKNSSVALKLNIIDTAGMLTNYAKTSVVNTKLAISDTSVLQRKNIAAYTFKANNTNAAANVTDQVYRDPGSQTYTGTITWNLTAPSGTTNHSYRWTQIGKMVTLNIHLNYGTAGVTNSTLQMALPADCPTPASPAGLGAAQDLLYSAVGYVNSSNAIPASTPRCGLRVNPAGNGYEIYMGFTAIGAKTAWATVTYWTN